MLRPADTAAPPWEQAARSPGVWVQKIRSTVPSSKILPRQDCAAVASRYTGDRRVALHGQLPRPAPIQRTPRTLLAVASDSSGHPAMRGETSTRDRKSTRLNSSHSQISYAVFCLKKKKKEKKKNVVQKYAQIE